MASDRDEHIVASAGSLPFGSVDATAQAEDESIEADDTAIKNAALDDTQPPPDPQFESETDDDVLADLPSTAFSPINFSITNRRIGDIFSSFNEGELDPQPAFQRGYVWDRIKASRLIESVLLHVPLPLVYTAETPDGREVVIDGQQRLMTSLAFCQRSSHETSGHLDWETCVY